MKILVISQPVWQNENNSGNTLSNVFKDFDGEFCNIYCSEGIPTNDICKNYYQITDYMVLKNITSGRKVGRTFNLPYADLKKKSFEGQARKHKNSFTILLRELAWKVAKVENEDLYKFIEDNKPDLIYAPTYGNFRMLRLVRDIKKKTGLPLVSFISDDLYNYKSGMNVLDRISQHFLRKSLKKSFAIYDLVYTATEQQKEEYEKTFGREMKIIRKNAYTEYEKHERNEVLKLIYAGGLYEGREAVLEKVAEAVKDLNKDKQRFRLDIYTGNAAAHPEILDDKTNSEVHPSLMYEELIKKYRESDIGLHVESFEKKYSERCRLSFSTKIIDCLQSGGALLAITPEDNAGSIYLKKENAALCINDQRMIKDALEELDRNYDKYRDMAHVCLVKNHDRHTNTERLEKEFKELLKK